MKKTGVLLKTKFCMTIGKENILIELSVSLILKKTLEFLYEKFSSRNGRLSEIREMSILLNFADVEVFSKKPGLSVFNTK